MRFIQEYGYSVKVGQDEAHQRWLVDNEPKFAAAHPPGTRYIGTFTTVYSSEKQAGSYKTYIELDSYGALDALAAAVKDESNELGRLVREWSAFSDYAWDAPWSNGLYKAVVDATVFDPE